MTSTIQRQAKTRADSGELSRDALRDRERKAAQPGPELKPGEWTHRGVMPAVIVPPKTGFARLMELAADIREEFDPIAKAQLEARYKVEAAALEDLSLDVYELKMKAIHAEITSAFGPIVAPADPADAEAYRVPAAMGRGEWKRMHKALLVARRRAAQWLTVSRKFAAERWGERYVTDAEAITPSPVQPQRSRHADHR